MIVNQAALQGMFTGFKTIFNKAFGETAALWPKVATLVPSEAGEESYKWLGQIPMMREWIGDRQIKNLEASDYTIKNKDFELTVGIPRNDVEDDKIGLYGPVVQSIAQSAATHPDQLVYGLLKQGFTALCYDGKAFFATDHKVGKGKVSNKGTAKLSMESYTAARAAMMSITNDDNEPLKIVPDLLVVPPALEGKAREILIADYINGGSNPMKGTATPLVVPDLAGADTAWYLLCTTRPVKPLIYQQRKKPQFVPMDKPDDANLFYRKEFVYGVDSRDNAGFGFWQMAYGSDGSANT